MPPALAKQMSSHYVMPEDMGFKCPVFKCTHRVQNDHELD